MGGSADRAKRTADGTSSSRLLSMAVSTASFESEAAASSTTY